MSAIWRFIEIEFQKVFGPEFDGWIPNLIFEAESHRPMKNQENGKKMGFGFPSSNCSSVSLFETHVKRYASYFILLICSRYHLNCSIIQLINVPPLLQKWGENDFVEMGMGLNEPIGKKVNGLPMDYHERKNTKCTQLS